MKTVFVKPNLERAKAFQEATGYEFHVKDPVTNRPIPDEGLLMESTNDVRRLIRCGDLIEATPPKAAKAAPQGGDK